MELKFGTSGLRGLVSDMTDREVYINTLGFISFLEEVDGQNSKKTVALAGDLRPSTERIMAAVLRAVKDKGWSVVNAGKIPTPALACFAFKENIAGIMVTGSHIPEDRNGIKFTKKNGEILKSDEADIVRHVHGTRHSVDTGSPDFSLFLNDGSFKTPQPRLDFSCEKEAVQLYLRRYKNFFPKKPLTGLKVVHYEHSSVGREIISNVLEELGATVITTGRSEKFIPVDTEKISETTRVLFKHAAKEHFPFAILSSDGDSDRPLLGDENGEIIPGDKLGGLAALYLKPDFAALPVTTNDAVIRRLAKENIQVKLTKIGSPYVIREMEEKSASRKFKKVAGWEANGGFLTGSDWEREGVHLSSLPTRDAVLPIVSVLHLAKMRKIPLSELFSTSFENRFSHSDIVDNTTPGMESYTADIGKQIIQALSPGDKSITQLDFQRDSCTVHRENQQLEKVSRDTSLAFQEIRQRVSSVFGPSEGFGEVGSINFIDGVRVTFTNNETLHLRPSGNAPEFRTYGLATTRERAEEIVEKRLEAIPRLLSKISGAGS